MKKYLCSFLLILVLSLFQKIIAQPKYEFRGVWVATVDNIDFPSNKFLNSFSQRAEFVNLLDMHKRNGMNAVVVQIRPAADAFYPSQYEPWSEWLTGTQGKPPSPYYDPLQFMITETHKRGMEFHAWMNPYRAMFNLKKSSISPTHVTRLHPDWFIDYGNTKFFDPGNKDVQKFVTNVVRDVVSRYDIDAIHFDDYFYPYRIAGKEFEDTASFRKYGNGLDRETWRRGNVDSIIVMLGRAIKEANPYCKFGISPFGVWRNIAKDPEGSNTKAGQTNYDDLYADILLWLRMKWIDYVVPQLYWEFGHKLVGYEVLIDWWAKHAYGRQMYIGQGIYRSLEAKSYAWKNKNELPNQIKKLREYPQVQGSVFFSSSTFNSNPNGWSDSLRNNYYKYPAIVPPMAWIDSSKPQRPELLFDSSKRNFYDTSIDLYLKVDSSNKKINRYVIYNFTETSNINKDNPKNVTEIIVAGNNFYHYNLQNIAPQQNKIIIAVTALTKTNNEGALSRYICLQRTQNGWQIVNLPGNE
ncbi:MAG: family 10 glycosylhydrolase [Bacteroidota bacterium]|nr:family 10 glycosylhydrolase [Bacteroidota bacterium]